MYSSKVLNIFNNPKNAGRISKPDGIASNYDFDGISNVEFSLRIEDNIITDCKFRAQANPYIIAVCSTIAEITKGKNASMFVLEKYEIADIIDENQSIDIQFCIDCVKMAIEDYKEKLEKSSK